MAIRLKAALCAAASLVCATGAQAARTLTISIEARGSGETILGYTDRGVPITQNIESVSANYVVVELAPGGSAFGPIDSPFTSQIFGFSDAGLKITSLTGSGVTSYGSSFSGNACFDGTAGIPIGSFGIDASCSSFQYNVANASGRGQKFTGAITRLSISEGSTLPDGATASITTTVPEPSTWALMLAGFGLMGYALRRRTRVAFA